MTTLIYDKQEKLVHADGRIMQGDEIVSETGKKCWQIPNNGRFEELIGDDKLLFFGAGCYSGLAITAELLSTPPAVMTTPLLEKFPKLAEPEFAFDAMIATSSGRLFAIEYPFYFMYEVFNDDRYHVLGSGANAARPMLLMNIPPDDVIPYVASADPRTGSYVITTGFNGGTDGK